MLFLTKASYERLSYMMLVNVCRGFIYLFSAEGKLVVTGGQEKDVPLDGQTSRENLSAWPLNLPGAASS